MLGGGPGGTWQGGCGQPARLYVKGAAELLLDSCRLQVRHLSSFRVPTKKSLSWRSVSCTLEKSKGWQGQGCVGTAEVHYMVPLVREAGGGAGGRGPACEAVCQGSCRAAAGQLPTAGKPSVMGHDSWPMCRPVLLRCLLCWVLYAAIQL